MHLDRNPGLRLLAQRTERLQLGRFKCLVPETITVYMDHCILRGGLFHLENTARPQCNEMPWTLAETEAFRDSPLQNRKLSRALPVVVDIALKSLMRAQACCACRTTLSRSEYD